MTKQVRKLEAKKEIHKTDILKKITIGFCITALALWISWFTCDCIFIRDGIWVDGIPALWEKIEWHWNESLFKIQEVQAIVLLGILGGLIVLLLSNMVVFGLYIKNAPKRNLYHLLTTATAFIAIVICVIKAAEMMINKKYVIDITIVPLPTTAQFDIYHLDYLKWMSIPPGAAVFIGGILLQSFEKFNDEKLIKDGNLLIIVYAILVVALFAPFVITFGWNDKALPMGTPEQLKELVESRITWSHITAQCITSPIGVFAGMLMVMLAIRGICVVFIYNNRWAEKKKHLIIFAIIAFLVIAAFIVAHSSPVDFEKLIFDYQSMKLGGLLVVLAEAVTCLAAGTYCTISNINYRKRA